MCISLTPISSALEGEVQAVGGRKPVGLGRDPGERLVSVLVRLREHQDSRWVADTQTSLLDGQTLQSSEVRQGWPQRALRVMTSPFATAASRPMGRFALESHTQDKAEWVYFLFLLSSLLHSYIFALSSSR